MTSTGTKQAPHVPVLVSDVIAALGIQGGETIIDGTFGAGGYTRALLSATNAQMSEPELRERVAFQISYCPQEPAAARVRAWAEDDPTAAARETEERLWILSAPDVAGPWLPPAHERRRLVETLTPKAHVEEGEEAGGPISRPDLSAAAIRRITERLRLESSA